MPFLTAFSGAAGSRVLRPGHPRLDWLAQVLVFHLLWLQHIVEGELWCFLTWHRALSIQVAAVLSYSVLPVY